jgi:glycosyltransferase involved in cell wall biosynthesis
MEQKIIKISWVIATRNRLTFLKILINKLLLDIKSDEEIIIVDGNSNDGTQDYLKELKRNGLIEQFISEPDINQAHAWNKAFLIAKGIYIKKLIDDDIFDFTAIRYCAEKLEELPDYDICISNELSMRLDNTEYIERHSRLTEFKEWKQGKVPSFTFGDVYLLIRRKSLSYIGLYNTSFHMMDYEYSLRISYLKIKILYFTGFNALSVSSNITVSSKVTSSDLKKEGVRANNMWDYIGDGNKISYWSRIKIRIGKVRDKIFWSKKTSGYSDLRKMTTEQIHTQYEKGYQILFHENKDKNGEFIF